MRSTLPIVAAFLFATSLFAQDSAKKANDTEYLASTSPISTSSVRTISGETPKNTQLTAAQARQVIRKTFNLLKEYSVSVDTFYVSTDGEANKGTDKNLTVKAAATPSTTRELTISELQNLGDDKFEDFLKGMDRILIKKIGNLAADSAKDVHIFNNQKGRLLQFRTMLASAQCLANRSEGVFIKTRDAQSNEIIAFPLDSLRSNPRYGLIDNYREGMARIKKDQVFGYLNYCGDEIIPVQYELAEPFNNGRALVKKVNWYYIDKEGNETDPLEGVAELKALPKGVTMAKMLSGKYTLIDNNYDKTKQPITGFFDAIEPFYQKQIFKVRNGKKVGLINLDGTQKLNIQYDVIEPSNVSNLFRTKIEDKWGLIDSLGAVKFKTEFDEISTFNQYDLATAKDIKGVRLISAKTYEITKAYNEITDLNQFGVAIARDEETKLYGLIDSDLKTIVKPTYYSLGAFNTFGLAQACRFQKECGYVNAKGEEIIGTTFEEIGKFSRYGLVVAKAVDKNCKENCRYEAVYDSKGKVVVPKLEGAEAGKIHYQIMDSLFSNRYISVMATHDDNGTGFQMIDKQKMAIVNATPYSSITPIDINGIFRVRNNNDWGLIDSLGKVVCKPMYDDIRRPYENYYPTKEKGKWGFIDKKGKPQIPFEYEEVHIFISGYAVVSKGKDKWGIISKFNAKVVPCVFKDINTLENGKYQVIDTAGNEFILTKQLDCEKNCTLFEQIRRDANSK